MPLATRPRIFPASVSASQNSGFMRQQHRGNMANRKWSAEDIRNARLQSAHRRRDSGDRQFITALARGLAILRCYRVGEIYLSNQDLARRSGLAKPTVSRLTYTL